MGNRNVLPRLVLLALCSALLYAAEGDWTFAKAHSTLELNHDYRVGTTTVSGVQPCEKCVAFVVTAAEWVHAVDIRIFYRVTMNIYGKPTPLLLSKDVLVDVPIHDAPTMSDQFDIPWDSIEFVRVHAFHTVASEQIGHAEASK